MERRMHLQAKGKDGMFYGYSCAKLPPPSHFDFSCFGPDRRVLYDKLLYLVNEFSIKVIVVSMYPLLHSSSHLLFSAMPTKSGS